MSDVRFILFLSPPPPTEDGDDWLQRVAAFSNKPSVKTNESYSGAPDLFQNRLVTP